jgi:hypothetical protein
MECNTNELVVAQLQTITERQCSDERNLEALRQLRNAAAQDEHQVVIQTHVTKLIQHLAKSDHELMRRLAWQVLYNCSVGHKTFVKSAAEELDELVITNLNSEPAKTQNVICAFLYLYFKDSQSVKETFKGLEMFLAIVCALQNSCDFALLLIKVCIKRLLFLPQIANLEWEQRLLVLDVVNAELEEGALAPDAIRFISQEFKLRCQKLMATFKGNEEAVEPIEASTLLALLGQASSDDALRPILQDDKSLLIDAIYLLKMAHDAGKGKESVNVFTPEINLTDLVYSQKEKSPVFAFKSNLIRLIGNLCFHHQANQDQVHIIVLSIIMYIYYVHLGSTSMKQHAGSN